MGTITKTEKIKDQGHGADVILATSNSHKATVDSVKGLRPDGRLILMGASATNEPFTFSPELYLESYLIITAS
jgi:alcohol dehydrogenase